MNDLYPGVTFEMKVKLAALRESYIKMSPEEQTRFIENLRGARKSGPGTFKVTKGRSKREKETKSGG